VNQHGPWRCLTTGGEVEQGLAYFDGATPQPQVLGYQYLRVMLAAALGFCALAPPGPPPAADRPRYVCVGLGTGALPGYLAHHLVPALESGAPPTHEPLLASSQLVAVEIDPVRGRGRLRLRGRGRGRDRVRVRVKVRVRVRLAPNPNPNPNQVLVSP
jgi:hypothetical protein